MIKVEVLGAGAWSRHIQNRDQLRAGLEGGDWPEASPPAPSLLKPAIRRRAPLSVKMAVDVMQQACESSGFEPGRMAIVYSSSFGDMDLTDKICSTLNTDPAQTSPTHFHNSVHNAATGYWTIATGVQQPANAISACGQPPAVSLLDAAVQAIFENTPVLLVSGEVEPPGPLGFTTTKRAPFAAAMILAPVGFGERPLATLELSLEEGGTQPLQDDRLPDRLGSEPDACLLNLLTAIPCAGEPAADLRIALSKTLHLAVKVISNGGANA